MNGLITRLFCAEHLPRKRQITAVLFWVIDEGSNIIAVFVVFEPDHSYKRGLKI